LPAHGDFLKLLEIAPDFAEAAENAVCGRSRSWRARLTKETSKATSCRMKPVRRRILRRFFEPDGENASRDIGKQYENAQQEKIRSSL
jgi:hypothetical protein